MARDCCITTCCQPTLSTLMCLLFLTTFSAETLGVEGKPPPPQQRSPRPSLRPRRPPPKPKSQPWPLNTTAKTPPSAQSTTAKPPPSALNNTGKPPPSALNNTAKPPPCCRTRPAPRPPPIMPPSPIRWRSRDGIRLAGSNITGIGRVELSIPTAVGYDFETKTVIYEPVWTPICSPFRYNRMPKLLCELLGFRYGQLYQGLAVRSYLYDQYSSGVSLRAEPQFLVDCDVKDPPGGKLVTTVGEYKCWFDEWTSNPDCSWPAGFRGLVELQCSNTKMPPAPPSLPPPPPPPRRDVKHYIKLVDLEENFSISSVDREYMSRVELLVNTSSNGRTGPSVWAPLCQPEGELNMWTLGKAICDQALADQTGHLKYVLPSVLEPLPIPTEEVPVGGFNPGNYKHWVTVVGGVKLGLDTVQEMSLKVTTTPCSSGSLLNIMCRLAMV